MTTKAPAAKRTRLTGPERERQLLDVAEQLFAEHGIEGVSVEDIARSAGVTRPIVYQHLGSRDSAFLACISRARQQFHGSLLARLSDAGDDLEECVAVGGDQLFDLIEKDPARWALLFTTSANLDGLVAAELARLRTQTIEMIADIARTLAPEVNEEQLLGVAYAISGIGEQLGRWWLRYPNIPRERVVAQWNLVVLSVARVSLGLSDDAESSSP